MAFTVLGAVQVLMIVTMSMLSACPSPIQASLHTPTPMLSLITAAYGISFAGLLLLAGAVVDLGRARRVLATAMMVLVAGLLTSAVAPTTLVLLIGRVVQGGAAAFAVPAALTLVTVVYPDSTTHGRAMTMWGILSGLGGITGLLYGGVIGTALSWRWTFTGPAVLAALVIVALPLVVPDTSATTGKRIDYLGAAAATVALGAGSYALVTGPEHGWRSGMALGPLITATTAATVCVLAERRSRSPFVPAYLVRSLRRNTALIGVFLASSAVTTVYFMLAIHFQKVFGWNELETALGFLPVGAVLLAAGPACSRVIHARINPLVGLSGGTGVTAVGLWLTGQAIDTHTYSPLLAGLIVFPLGVAMMFSAGTTVAMTNVTNTSAGRAGGLLNAAMEAGPTFGLTGIVSAAAMITHSASPQPSAEQTSHGFAVALQAAAGAYLAIAILAGCGLTMSQRHNQTSEGTST